MACLIICIIHCEKGEKNMNEKDRKIVDDMQFAKYAADIREILENIKDKESLENLVRNVVAYAESNNRSKINWIAHELFMDVIPDELIAEIFDDE